MTFCLDSIIIKPENGVEIENAIILLHGYGGDGKDISMLSLNWKRHMPNTVFICPNGHEPCAINPSGYQWFDLTKDNSDYILEQSIKAEEVLKKFINEIKKEFKLSNNQICLSGFSQGCMMSINVGLTFGENFLCIVGFSGKIINQNDLKNRIKNIIIAYEPVWSSGTGLVPQNNELLDNILFIKKFLRKNFKYKNSRVLYGGSVNPNNIKNLNEINQIDGFLIGGASQSANKFIDIIKKTVN